MREPYVANPSIKIPIAPRVPTLIEADYDAMIAAIDTGWDEDEFIQVEEGEVEYLSTPPPATSSRGPSGS